MPAAPLKRCNRCGKSKASADFPVDKSRKDGRYPWCKDCKSAYMQDRYAANRERISAADYRFRLIRRYGISVEDYDALMEQQASQCAICGATEAWARHLYNKRFAIDHDHETGKVRGLLCSSCNRGLGYFAEDPERLIAAAQYLINSKGDSNASQHRIHV